MDTTIANRSRGTTITLLALLLVFGALAFVGCSNQANNTNSTINGDADQSLAAAAPIETDDFEETMQISPFKINLLSKGASESVMAIIGLSIPAGYSVTDYAFSLSFNDQEVVDAYDCYYCYVDDNLIISFDKNSILSSPVTLEYSNTQAVAAVNGYFRVESDSDGYDTDLSRVAMVEIICPAQNIPDPEAAGANWMD